MHLAAQAGKVGVILIPPPTLTMSGKWPTLAPHTEEGGTQAEEPASRATLHGSLSTHVSFHHIYFSVPYIFISKMEIIEIF